LQIASRNPLRNLKLWPKTALLIVVPLALELVVIFQVYQVQQQLETAYRNDSEVSEAVVLIHQCMNKAYDAMRELVYFETQPGGRGDTYHARFKSRISELDALKNKLTRHPAVKSEALGVFLEDLKEQLRRVDNLSDVTYEDFNKLMAVQRASFLGKELTRLSDSMLADQEKRARLARAEIEKKRQEFDKVLLLSAANSVLFAILLAMLFNVDILSQMRIMMNNTSRFARGETLHPQIKGSDEFAQLDDVFHSMVHSIKALSEREKAIFRNTTELIFVLDENYNFVFINDACRTMLGKPPEELLQTSIVELNESVRFRLEAGQTLETLVFETTLDEREVEISAHWSARDGSFYCVAHDIGARKELERMKQSFLAMVTHDLRSPIAANQLALEMLLNESKLGALTPEGQQIVQRILSSDRKLMRLINDLLDMEKLNAGQLSLDLALASFNDVTEEAIELLEPIIRSKNIKIDKDDNDTLILCDSARIVQVVANILSNALKFSEEKQAIEMRYSEDSESSIISITDHGPGIPIEFLPQLFEQFTQTGDKDIARKGSGLGLAISKKLVDLHNGEIVVATEIGEGTTFEIHLPKKI